MPVQRIIRCRDTLINRLHNNRPLRLGRSGVNSFDSYDAGHVFDCSDNLVEVFLIKYLNGNLDKPNVSKDDIGLIEVTVEVFDKKHLDKVVSSIAQVPGVIEVERVNS